MNLILYLTEPFWENMGLFKKLKDSAEKGIEKGAELGTKGYDSAKDATLKGIEKGAELGTRGYDNAKDAAKKGHAKAREKKEK